VNNTQFITLLIVILGSVLFQFAGFFFLFNSVAQVRSELAGRIDRIADDLKRS
jgi:hypothetical protein